MGDLLARVARRLITVFDRNVVPTLKEIDDALTLYVVHHKILRPGEHPNLSVHLIEPVLFHEGAAPTYRRVYLTDATAHPGAVESLVRHAAIDLGGELRPHAQQYVAR